mmetsp:Transcript_19453/g.49075  ORF Transcript_19453/g.49075 Transcript_19453/m.49075 type:complete len:99 (+) Transcript_19453:872-1168(+)
MAHKKTSKTHNHENVKNITNQKTHFDNVTGIITLLHATSSSAAPCWATHAPQSSDAVPCRSSGSRRLTPTGAPLMTAGDKSAGAANETQPVKGETTAV